MPSEKAQKPAVRFGRRRTRAAGEVILLGRLTQALTAGLGRGEAGAADVADAAVTWARETTGADAAELFLSEPISGDAVLTAYDGPYRSSFTDVPRFGPGAGFPGAVIASGAPLATTDLAGDVRFERPRVVQRGFRCYAGVPLPDPTAPGDARPIGMYAIASRRCDAPLAQIQRVLALGAGPIAVALQAALYRARQQSGAPAPDVDAPAGDALDHALREVARRTALLAGADGAAAFSLAGATGKVARSAVSGEWPAGGCPALLEAHGAAPCPALDGAGGLVLTGARSTWPPACRQAERRGVLWYCLPLMAAGRRVGLVQAARQRATREVPTRRLRALVEAAEAAGPLVAAALDAARADMAVGVVDGEFPPGVDAAALRAAGLVEIRCFGPFEVRLGGALVTRERFARRMAFTLLKILVTYRDRPVPSETLVEWLWPESDPVRGANRLHAVAHVLRRVLEPLGASPLIANDRGFYRLNPGAPLRLDVNDFLSGVRRGRQADARSDAATALAAYDDALRACRGDFMEDESFAEWCWQEREHLREMRLSVLERAAALHAAAGDLDKSIAYLRHGLRLDPLREDLHRAMLDLLMHAGRHEEAVGRYATLRDVLARELGVAPQPKTEYVMQGIGGR